MSWSRTWHESVARRELAALRTKLIAAGQDVVAARVGAAIDQHAAAIRDILTMTAVQAGPIQLAAYTRGIQDVAADRGWRPGTGSGGPDWITLRLLAACDLAASDPPHGLPAI